MGTANSKNVGLTDNLPALKRNWWRRSPPEQPPAPLQHLCHNAVTTLPVKSEDILQRHVDIVFEAGSQSAACTCEAGTDAGFR